MKIRTIESSETISLRAGKLKATHRISLADAYIAAVSQEFGGILVHKDPEFETLAHSIREYKLPYKKHGGKRQ